jgi:hypothetical protein
MARQNWFCGIAFAIAVVGIAATGARAFDDAKYPDMRGAWARPGAAQWDPTKPPGMRQQAPLTAEYETVFKANMANTESGGQEYNPQVVCLPSGVPRVMIAYEPLELIITPAVTYIRFDQFGETRRVYTDGRDWPHKLKPGFDGYSIGKWVDVDGDGRFDVLEIETRGFKGPRLIDQTGMPLHADNQTIVKEQIFLDRENPNRLHDQITTVDHAYTRPWTVTRDYARLAKPVWTETNCMAENTYVWIGHETYFISLDGFLMPTKKNQVAPDLKYFEQSRK